MSGPGVSLPITGTVDPALLAGLVTLATNITNAGKASEDAGKKAKDSVKSWGDLEKAARDALRSQAGVSASGLASGPANLLRFGQAALAAAEQVANLAAEQQRLDMMSRRLGLNFDEAADSAGRFTDEVDVMNAAGAFAARGIHLTQTELNALTHAAARNAQQTGVETSQALDTLTSALVRGRARGLAPFGAELAATAAHGYTLREGLAGLVEQEAHMASATNDSRTSMDAFSDAMGDASRGFATLISNGLGLDGVVATLTRKLGDLSGALRAINDPLQTAEGRAASDDRNAAMGEYARARAAMRAQLERGGGDVSLLPGIDVANQTPAQLRNQAAALRDISGRAGGDDGRGGGILIGGVDPLAPPIELTTRDAERELRALRASITHERAELAAADARAAAEEERNRRHTITANTGANAAAQEARKERTAEDAIRAEAAATTLESIEERHRAAMRAIQEVGNRDHRRLLEEREADARRSAQDAIVYEADAFTERHRLEQQHAERSIRLATDTALQVKAAEREGGASSKEYRGANRTTLTAGEAVNDNAAEYEGQVRARFLADAQGVDSGVSMADQIAAKEQRTLDDSIARHESYTGRLAELNEERVHGAQLAAEFTNDAFGSMGKALGKHIGELAAGREEVDAAMQGMLADTLTSVGSEAMVKGGFYFAQGLGQLAGVATAPLAPASFGASAAFFAVGAAATAGGAALAPAPATSGAGGGGRPALGNGGAGGMLADRPSRDNEGGTVINVNFGGSTIIGAGGARQAAREIANVLNEGNRQGGVTLAPALMGGGRR